MIRAEIWLMPATSTTEYIIVMSMAPTYGRVSPDATVDTTSFGTPTGSCCIAWVTSEVPPVPPMPTMPSSRPSAVQPLDDLGRAPAHRLDRRPAVPGGHELPDLGSGRLRDLLPRDIGIRCRLPEHPRVDEDHVDPVLPQAIAEECVLRPLGVQGADRHDARHRTPPRECGNVIIAIVLPRSQRAKEDGDGEGAVTGSLEVSNDVGDAATEFGASQLRGLRDPGVGPVSMAIDPTLGAEGFEIRFGDDGVAISGATPEAPCTGPSRRPSR